MISISACTQYGILWTITRAFCFPVLLLSTTLGHQERPNVTTILKPSYHPIGQFHGCCEIRRVPHLSTQKGSAFVVEITDHIGKNKPIIIIDCDSNINYMFFKIPRYSSAGYHCFRLTLSTKIHKIRNIIKSPLCVRCTIVSSALISCHLGSMIKQRLLTYAKNRNRIGRLYINIQKNYLQLNLCSFFCHRKQDQRVGTSKQMQRPFDILYLNFKNK